MDAQTIILGLIGYTHVGSVTAVGSIYTTH